MSILFTPPSCNATPLTAHFSARICTGKSSSKHSVHPVICNFRNDGCRLELRGRLTAGHEADEACPVIALDRVLGDLMEAGTRHFEIDISGLKEIDISGVQVLHRLRNRAGCTLIIPGDGINLNPLLTIELLTRFEWSTSQAA